MYTQGYVHQAFCYFDTEQLVNSFDTVRLIIFENNDKVIIVKVAI